ncbi:alpha/beta hydrolase family protein [Microbacterium sp. NPDC055665]
MTLPSTPLTRYDGEYALRSSGGYARAGKILEVTDRTVTRELLEVTGDVYAATDVTFDGDVIASPSVLGAYVDVQIPTEHGPAPAWRFDRGGESRLWIIHVHGYQANRLNALRTVSVLHEIPSTHLVVSYRGDGDAPASPNNTTRLGLDEWRDVDAALEFAVDHGAERVVMVGWSMGASIALLLEERSRHRSMIIGNVFVGPATDWRAIMTTSARRMGIPAPRALTALCVLLLSSRIGCRLAGVRAPINFPSIDWTRAARVGVPTLVIHSAGDMTSPLEATRRFLQANDPWVELVELRRAPHTREYNVDPEGFRAAALEWVRRLVS